MFRRAPRVVFVVIIFFFAVTTFQLLLNRESSHRLYFQQKLRNNEVSSLVDNPLHLLNLHIYPTVTNYERKDWHDREFMRYEATRQGPGENGTAFNLTDPKELLRAAELQEIEGLNVYVSDKISVNRSLPDVRHKK